MKVYRNLYHLILLVLISSLFNQDFDELFFGTEDNLDLMTWNIEWFPKNDEVTIDYVSQIINALDMDIIALQEISDTTLFNQMLSQLIEYDGYLESEWFAGLAYIYRIETIEINEIYEIYTTSPYWSPFPRSPMVMDMNFMGENYIIINNHFKCCGDGYLDLNDTGDEEYRRYLASILLKEYIDYNFSNTNVIILGDLNDVITDEPNNNVFQIIIDDSDNYVFADMEIAEDISLGWSFPNWPSHIDHIIITNEIFDVFYNMDSHIETIRIDQFMDGGFSEYDQNISDHLPVALKLATYSFIPGDLNGDEMLNILDIVLMINMILDNGYNLVADVNGDSFVDILDIVIMVNILIGGLP